MFRAKDVVRLLFPRIAACLTLALSLMELGCSGVTGLRSVGTDRPSLLGLWDRPEPPPPDPAADYYARYMRSARDRADGLAKRSNSPPESTRDEGGGELRSPGDEVADTRTRSGANGRIVAPTKPARDATIQVTLGPPEPLPGLAEPSPRVHDTDLATTRSSSSPSIDNRRPIEADRGPSPRLARHDDDPDDDRRNTRKTKTSRPKPRENEGGDAKAILARSEARLQSLKTYQVKISRTERVGGRILPEEQIILSIRRDPKSVRLEWADGPNQGREVIYSSRIDDKSLFVHMPKSAIPLPTMKIAVDSPLVMKNSRHAITEAGFDTIINNLRKSLDGTQKTDMGRLAYRGVEKPPGLDRPSHVFTRRAPSGETWTVFLDATTMLPSMVVAKDASGEMDERYVYHEVREDPTDLASAEAFDPDQRWGQSQGFLSRFARATPGSDRSNNRQSTTR
jgi:hypothetical protein